MGLISTFDPWRSGLCTCPSKLSLNPYTGCDYGCTYCYASSYVPRFSCCRPKKDLLKRLRKEADGLNGELLSISNSSDPYPALEAETGLTRGCLEILSEHNCGVQVVTKSPLVARDIDLLTRICSMVCMTVTTDDDNVARLIEPGAPPPSARLKAVERLVDAGVPVSVRVDPVIPFVNDDAEDLVQALASLGVRHVTSSTFKVRADSWRRFSARLPVVAKMLSPLYFQEGMMKSGYRYLPDSLRLELMKRIGDLVKKHRLKYGTCREGLSCLNTAACDGSWLLNKRVS